MTTHLCKNFEHKYIYIPTIADSRGNLAIIDNAKSVLPFKVQRVFWIYNVPEGQVRGLHAHRTCSEVLVTVKGSLSVILTDKNGTKEYNLNSPNKGLLIRPFVWCKLEKFSSDCVCICFASEAYDETGYINDWDSFSELIK
ncbi:sugar 3,4-ketoisomerase [Alloprevotella rava]|uniref:Sugar 3,4-ketoisomerase QdtA cupin domain-containing protein n=2 Tax=Alloprevotella rava TaxID=671218 RepID=G5G9A0_9BACT|nr:FdtA/QdtA family cupin domain-containing protein [Alloprevotella rava]EHG24676.1 hypothetical protein HMPREF9332_00151 [Alloprevotella rava F0323]MBB3703455.1 dTDP-4-dehydrorhamnose 3,5-epimerase-like enzyme [Alloprevotella rava]